MKKLIFFLISFFILPLTTFALDPDYDVTNMYVKANILANGNMDVKELIVLKGDFNGYERDLVYTNSNLKTYTPGNIDFSNSAIYNAKGISNISIKGGKVSTISYDMLDTNSFTDFSLVSSAYNGDTNKYTQTTASNGYNIRMYDYTYSSKTAFLISYTVDNAVVIHNDVAELYWTFIGSNFDDSIGDSIIKVYLPSSDASDYFRIWAHGDLSGDINFIEDNNEKNGAVATISDLSANSQVDIRMTFNKSLITGTNVKYSQEDAFDKILEVEQQRANAANIERERVKNLYYGEKYLTIVFYVALILAFIYVYNKFDKERKPQFQNKYNREFIDSYNVEVLDYLMHHDITPNAMSASIMNLIYKKNITVNKIDDKNYEFTLVNRNNLNDTENYLCDFLFNKIGSENKFTTISLKTYAKSSESCEDFINTYTRWKNQVIQDGKQQNFFEKQSKPKIIGAIILLYGIIVAGLAMLYEIEYPLSYIAFVLGVLFMIYTSKLLKKTETGIEDYAKWKAFKNFLNDFGTFDLKELLEIVLWERYLVYATLFGLAKKVSKDMNVKIQEYPDYMNTYGNTIFYYDFGPTISYSVSSAVNGAHAAINAKNASSSMSSGGGFGGGFSSGGGFGGGGGGGHGF
jgi:uncharacterized membrane protein